VSVASTAAGAASGEALAGAGASAGAASSEALAGADAASGEVLAGAGAGAASNQVRAGAAFEWPVRVYWEDTDAGGVVYYANYLKFLERSRTEWLRSLGHSQTALAVDPGILFMVVNLQVEYLKPARLDDALLVTCEPERDGRVALRIRQRILRDAPGREPLLLAELRVACLDAHSRRPRRIPEFVT
jgi:acyl-CoA thioester hydrolase